MLKYYKSACIYIAAQNTNSLIRLALRDILLTVLTGFVLVLGLNFMRVLPSATAGAIVIAILVGLNLAHMVLTYALGKRWARQLSEQG